MPAPKIIPNVTAPWASPGPVVCVPPQLTTAIHKWVVNEKPSLADGPHFYANNYEIYGDRGNIKTHKDGAGLTMGLVLVADGPRFLEVDDQRWPLHPGSVYLIDSDKDHASPCAWQEGLLVFACIDFVGHYNPSNKANRKAPTTPTKFASDGLLAAAKIFNVRLNQTS